MKKVSVFAVLAVNFVGLGGGVTSIAATTPGAGLTCEMIQKQDTCAAFKTCTWDEVTGCTMKIDPAAVKEAPKGGGRTNNGGGG